MVLKAQNLSQSDQGNYFLYRVLNRRNTCTIFTSDPSSVSVDYLGLLCELLIWQ